MSMFDNVLNDKELKEANIPNDLEEGDILVGTIRLKDDAKDIYYSNNAYVKVLPRVIVGPSGSGKTHYMVNMAKDVIKSGRGFVAVDTSAKSELSEAVKAFVSEDRLVEIDCSNSKHIQSFSYNELKITDDIECDVKMLNIRKKAECIVDLINSISDNNETLTISRLEYLYAASIIVFYTNSNATLREIIDVLVDVDKRIELIGKLDKEDKVLLEDEISILEMLNKRTKFGIENNDIKIQCILERVSLLKRNMYTKLAFEKDGSNDIDFMDAINKNKVILIKIPVEKINSIKTRDIIANFYLTKIWLAKQIGNQDAITELFFDGMDNYSKCKKTIEGILYQQRVFNFTPVISMNVLRQSDELYRDTLLSVGSSFILMPGCNTKLFDTLEDYFKRSGYAKKDLYALEKYHALSLVATENGHSGFIVKLPN